MISIHAREINNTWYGLAYIGERILATAVAPSKQGAIRSIMKSLPPGTDNQIIEKDSAFIQRTINELEELHLGNEGSKNFVLASEYFPEHTAKVLKMAAAIPIGYVASYGGIAAATDTGPRTVGQIMAANPIYPIVPCHRVVGSDFSLIGYGGRKNTPALQAKLGRLVKEAKGFTMMKEIQVNGRNLTVYPVENVIKKAGKQGLSNLGQQSLTDIM